MAHKGKVAVVIGGARGIGRTYCEVLLTEGAKVVCGDVLTDVGETTAKELTEKHGQDRISFYPCDITNAGQIEGLCQAAKHTFGNPSICVTSAGTIDEFDWQKVVTINLCGCISSTNVALKYMSKEFGGTGGDIIHTASMAALKGNPKFPIYAATKHGQLGLVRSLGDPMHVDVTGVRINCICPTKIDTPLNEKHKIRPGKVRIPGFDAEREAAWDGLPVDIVGDALLKLLEDKVTGQALCIAQYDGITYAEFPVLPT